MHSNQAKDRFSWAVSLIQPGASDHLLEIGCGAGLLVEQLAARLTNGAILAVDQSEALFKAARKRNAYYIDKGVVGLIKQDYATIPFNDQQFDKIIAFNVSGCWQKPRQFLPKIYKQLKPEGRFYLFYQPPFNKTAALVQEAQQVLTKYTFHLQEVHLKDMEPASAFCIISTLAQ
jgi:cyclopropane fatty-acyl-phospholipid synthase-like methyltransferase